MMLAGFTSRCTMPAPCAADKSGCNLIGVVERIRQAHAAGRNQFAKRSAAHVLHGDIIHSVDVFDFVDGYDVRMVQAGSSFGFTLEASTPMGVGHLLRRQDFESH